MDYRVKYKVSLYPSQYTAYHSTKGKTGEVKLYISTIWDFSRNFKKFVRISIFLTVLERICLERAFQKIKMKNRCKDYKGHPCKMQYLAYKIMDLVDST